MMSRPFPRIEPMQPPRKTTLQSTLAGIAMALYAGLLVLCLCAVYDLALSEARADQRAMPEATCPSDAAEPAAADRPSARVI
jgi:hypothetical protein